MPALARHFVRGILIRWSVILLALVLLVTVAWWKMILMPGKSYKGDQPPLTEEELRFREEMRSSVQKLGGDIGERNVNYPAKLAEAADFIEQDLQATNLRTKRQGYDVRGVLCHNIEAEQLGTKPEEIVVVGAHYDSAPGNPGSNDNGSGVAGLLALAKRFSGKPCVRTVRFVAFVNEEPVHFQTELMGSMVYAKMCKQRNDKITAMVSLETIGYFRDEPGSQHYPLPGLNMIYPDTGNFIAFVGNVSSGALVRQAVGSFRKHAKFPSEGAALPSGVPGVGWSDHWAFWQHDYPAIMVTDTAPFRYPHYHRASDTPDKLSYDSMARVVSGMEKVIRDLADAK